MIHLALVLQVLTASDSTYASPTLRDFVARAAANNRTPPPELRGYRARVESELAFILRDSLGRELVGQVEQLAGLADWSRDGEYEIHVVGYRAQTLGNPYSALTFTRMYSVPTLFGSRLALGMNDGIPRTKSDSVARQKRMARDSAAGRPPFRAVHPLADDRDRYYRFTGGDTVAVVRSASGREIRIVRIFAHPVNDRKAHFFGFRGELDFDADRHHLVRMRGRFESVTTERDPLFARATGAVAMAYVEFENAEVDGRYWLPSVQRSEFQAQMGLLGDARPIYRIVTRFREHVPDTVNSIVVEDSTSLPATRARLTFARSDSASRFGAWTSAIGTLSGGMSGGDFDDLAPDAWRPTGAPRFTLWPKRLEDVVRYNRVEGMFTGASASLAFRDAMPGLSARGTLGWAWSEETARGMASVSLARGSWTNAVKFERTLAPTNDFMTSLETGLSIFPILGVDDYDYVDRWSAGWSLTRFLKNLERGFVSVEGAVVRDRHVPSSVAEPLFGGDAFRANRIVRPGDYARGVVVLELSPDITGESLSPGLGARVRYEVAAGDLDWQRVEVRLAGRHYWKGIALASRLDGGFVTSSLAAIPPQALFEIGGGMELPSYEYKEFGGDRAAIGRALAAYYFPVLRTPRRLGRIILPGLSPGIGVGIQGGWAEASSAAARAGLLELGGDGLAPISEPTGHIRSTLDVRMTFLSGAFGFGLARPLDEARRWTPFFLWGAAF